MRLKIGEIAKKSGVPPSTIRFYVRQGLLPEPDKVNKSMAYYDESCIEKVRAIRHLQEKKYFPLAVIKNILRRMDQGLGLEEAEAIENAVFCPEPDPAENLVDKAEFLKLTGLTKTEYTRAMDLGLLMPYFQEKGRTLFNPEDIRFGREVLKRLIEFGHDLNLLDFYVELGRKIVEHEVRFRKEAVKGKSQQENIRITTEISKMADFLRSYIMRRLFQRRVQTTIQKSLKGSS
ncbi:MAG TPA: MerR family transcriptional regulator [Deltaproteobacteria bacterium]|nr:MerR family transcriptional regulator [Deltaproteobacteria bacterium]